jgi:hypothetical protein
MAADPISKIGVKAIMPQPGETPGLTTGKKFELPAADKVTPAAGAEPKPVAQQPLLRQRIEQAGSQQPKLLFGDDMGQLSKRIEAMSAKRVPPTVRAELEKVEARFHASQAKLQQIPETNNLRDLLQMQTEIYEMTQSVELLTKVIDSTTSGVKQTLQMQV